MERKYKSFEDLPSTLGALELADYLGISRTGAYTLLRSQGFPTLKIGGRMVVQKENLRIWCKENTAPFDGNTCDVHVLKNAQPIE